MIVCDFCLKKPPPGVQLVEAPLKSAHICEHCVLEAVAVLEARKDKP